jgi:hypothetical protein
MSPEKAVLDRFREALPRVRTWIEHTLERHEPQGVRVSRLGHRRLPRHFSRDLLDTARVVSVPEVPFPPLTRLGLEDLAEMERRPLAAITYGHVVFVVLSESTESLCFHELVHVVQWARLGVDRFLWAYGLGLLRFGYRESPLEAMAYELELAFERDEVPENLVQVIEQRTDAVWADVASRVGVVS